MQTRDHFEKDPACPTNSLVAMLENPGSPQEVFIVDLAEDSGFATTNHQIIEAVVQNNLTIFADAKASLQSWNSTPSPHMRLACLSTIKKIIAKHHHESLNLPNFLSPAEALPWLKAAANDAFDRINKLRVAALCTLEAHVIPATIAMERKGLPFNKARWQDALAAIDANVQTLKARLAEILPNDNGFLLFGQEPVDLHNANAVKASLEKLLGTKLSGTSQASLKDFNHEAVTLIVRYREQARMLSNYGEAFLEKITQDRIKGHFTPIGSASGRFACHDTNLLALPNDQMFQSCIAPQAPYVMLHFDYGAFELRILAALSGDDTLLRIFNDDQDIHSMVAQELFGCTVSKTENAHLRDQAKVLNFGLIYGMGETALAKQLAIPKSEAHALLTNYFKRFHRVGDYLTMLEEMARHKGYVATALGRRAFLGDIEDAGQLARLARNIPIQGTGADIAKLALCRVYQRLHDEHLDAQVINLVHDELVVEAHGDQQHQVAELVMAEMKHAFSSLCPEVIAAVSMSG